MKLTIDLLSKLQRLDDEIDALKAEEESIPGKKEELEEGLRAIEAKVSEGKEQSIDLAKLRKEKEVELESAGEKASKFQSQLFQVKSNREYEALQHEISALEEKISQLEDEILEILERSEEASKAIVREQDALEAESGRVETEGAELDQELKKLRETIAVKGDERERLVMNLDPMLLKRYERIRENKGGLAVTPVKNGACGGCFRRIPPQEMQELKKNDRIIMCEGCGRIIIWKEEA
jgi:predicted  nucleic acid-binding Zn-ribbon protein